VYNFVPTTFVLPNEYVNFMREYAEQTEKAIWICKPSDSSRGRGIFLISDMSQLIYDQQYVIQQYISNPLLLGGFKFDLRLYVLITSFFPIRCYLYKEVRGWAWGVRVEV
jgi:tubulin polyglutamylase TTLL2